MIELIGFVSVAVGLAAALYYVALQLRHLESTLLEGFKNMATREDLQGAIEYIRTVLEDEAAELKVLIEALKNKEIDLSPEVEALESIAQKIAGLSETVVEENYEKG